jgi:hypothetical protein
MVDNVKDAILDGIHPKMIAKGSSGSYFARANDGDRTKTVGCVFHPLIPFSLSHILYRVFKVSSSHLIAIYMYAQYSMDSLKTRSPTDG